MSEPKLPTGAPGQGDEVPEPAEGIRRYIFGGLFVTLLLVGGAGGWAATAKLSGAIIAQGSVVVESNVKKVQHPTGGVIGVIKVKNGDRVKAGDLLVRLDETLTRANLQIITKQLDELMVREARLKAERDDKTKMDVPAVFKTRMKDSEVADMVAGEQSLFTSRRKARLGQKEQLGHRVEQYKQEIKGLEAQAKAKATEVVHIKKELVGLEKLWKKKLVPVTKMTAMRREAARLDGETARLQAMSAQAEGKISETKVQMIQLDRERTTEVVNELRQIQAKKAELVERRVAALDQLKRIDIRAPRDGIVHELNVHTIGGVINQSEPLMLIVPEGDKLVIEAKVSPSDIDHVYPGREAFILFSAFNQRVTPEFKGEVTRVSATVTRDAQLNVEYYTARLKISKDDREKVQKLKLVPGMPAEIHVKTVDRTALSYLTKPLWDQMNRVFKED